MNQATRRGITSCCPLFVLLATATLRADIPGACCFPDGSCDVYTNTIECVEDGGVFAGVGVTCGNADCPVIEPVCDETLKLSSCPTVIVVETLDAEGVAFDGAGVPAAQGCDVSIIVEPAIGEMLSIGENTIRVTATDAMGELALCTFVVIVDLIEDAGPIQKRRIKGGGAPDGNLTDCASMVPAVGGPLCGTCQFTWLLGAFACVAAFSRRRTFRRSRGLTSCCD